MPATAEEEDQRVQCFDDIFGKELPWTAIRQACDQSLKYVCDFGVCDKFDERDAIARYQVTPVSTRGGSTQTEHSRESPCKPGHDSWHENSKVETDTTYMQWTVGSVESKKQSPSQRTTSKHSQSCTSTCHVHTFTQKLRDLYWYFCPWRTEGSPTPGN